MATTIRQSQGHPPQGIEDTIQLLIKRKHFASAAAYNLRCLDSMLVNNGVVQDTLAIRQMIEKGGIAAVLECLGDCRASAGEVLLQAGCTVLNRALRAFPKSAEQVESAQGVVIVVGALEVVDEWPAQAIEFLGLMAEGGKADAAVRCGCVPLLTRALRECMDHDHDVAHASLLSLGQLLQRTTVPRLQVMPEALDRQALTEAISACMHRCIPKTLESVRASVSALLWLAKDDEAIITQLRESGMGPLLLGLINKHEGEGPELLSVCGELLYLLCQGEALKQALQDLAALDCQALEEGAVDGEILQDQLSLIAGLALVRPGRAAVGGASEALDKVLEICDTEAYECVRIALRTVERLAYDATLGRDLLQRGAMDKAISVLKRSSSSAYEDVPGEAVAAAASVVARLTEVMLLRGTGTMGDSSRLGRRMSNGFSDAKVEALRCAVTAYGRHPNNIVLFRGLLDLAISNLRRRKGHEEDALWEEERSVMLTALETLLSLTDMDMPKAHQAVFRDKLWSVNGIEAALECMKAHEPELSTKMRSLLHHVATLGGAKARDLPFLLHYSQPGEDLLHLLEAEHLGSKEGVELIELLRPLLELKPKPDDPRSPPRHKKADSHATPAPAAVVEEEVDVRDVNFNLSSDEEDNGAKDDEDPFAGTMGTMEGSVEEGAMAFVSPHVDSLVHNPQAQGTEEGDRGGLFFGGVTTEGADDEEDAQLEMDGPCPEVIQGHPPAWIQVFNSQGMAYFVHTESGAVQWEVPDDLLHWWELNGIRQEETIQEGDGWQMKIDPVMRTAFFEPSGGDSSGRFWRLPSEVPVTLGFDGPMTIDSESSSLAPLSRGAAGSSPIKGQGQYAFAYEADEGGEEEEAVDMYLDGLRDLRRDADQTLHAHQGPAHFARNVGQYAALARQIEARKRKPGSERSRYVVLERDLAGSLSKTLQVVEDGSTLLDYYKGAYERELAAHERKGEIGPLEATMALLKGEVIQHTPTELANITKIIVMMERNPLEVEKVFKEAHLLIKRLVVEQTGEMPPNTHWTLTQEKLDSIPAIYLQQLLQHLRMLVISYDNMTDDMKHSLTTAAEIIKNRDWLVAIAVRCVDHHTKLTASLSKRQTRIRRSSSDLSASGIGPLHSTLSGTSRSKGPSDPRRQSDPLNSSNPKRPLPNPSSRRRSDPPSSSSSSKPRPSTHSPSPSSSVSSSRVSAALKSPSTHPTSGIKRAGKGGIPTTSASAAVARSHVAVRSAATSHPHSPSTSIRSTSSSGSLRGGPLSSSSSASRLKMRFDPFSSPTSKAVPVPEVATQVRRPSAMGGGKTITSITTTTVGGKSATAGSSSKGPRMDAHGIPTDTAIGRATYGGGWAR